MEDKEHIVDFYTYCPTCKYFTKDDNEYPCYECISIWTRMNSRKPEKWEE